MFHVIKKGQAEQCFPPKICWSTPPCNALQCNAMHLCNILWDCAKVSDQNMCFESTKKINIKIATPPKKTIFKDLIFDGEGAWYGPPAALTRFSVNAGYQFSAQVCIFLLNSQVYVTKLHHFQY